MPDTSPTPTKWEEVDTSDPWGRQGTLRTHHLRVPGGWLYRETASHFKAPDAPGRPHLDLIGFTVALCFVSTTPTPSRSSHYPPARHVDLRFPTRVQGRSLEAPQ